MIAIALRNWKCIVGGIGILALGVMLILARADAHHWHKLADAEKAAHAGTIANYRAAAEIARRKDAENVTRVQTEQSAITQEVTRDYQARLADARRRADALRVSATASRANPGSTGTTGVSANANAASGPDGATGEAGFSISDRLIATETAIRLIALQDWVRRQSAVSVGNGDSQ